MATTILLQWTQPDPPFPEFKIHVGTSPGTYNTIHEVGNVTEFLIPNLDYDSSYYLAVEGVGGDSSVFSDEFHYHTKKNPNLKPIVIGVRDN